MISQRMLSRSVCLSLLLSLSACGGNGKDSATPESGGTDSGANGGGGGKNSGGTGQTATGGKTDRPDPGPFVPPTCSKDSSMARPPEAPVLEVGAWKDISPPDLAFNVENKGNFTQGMTIDPCNPATIYLCVVSFGSVEFNGLYRTTDAGTSWRRIGPFDFPIRVRVDPNDPKHLYATDGVSGATHGFWISHDGGDTWAIPESFKELAMKELAYDSYHVEPDPADFSHLLVTFHNPWKDEKYDGNSGILESFDAGESWIIHPAPNPTWSGGYNVFFLYNPEQKIGDSNTWLFGTQGDGYYRTSDAGENWKKVARVSMDHGGASLYYTPEGVLYASGSPNLLRSEDNGENWTEVTPTMYTAFLTVAGDGKNLYTLPHFGGEVKTAPASTGTGWVPLGNDPPQFVGNGAFEMVFDKHNRILYNASTGAGLWARQLPPE